MASLAPNHMSKWFFISRAITVIAADSTVRSRKQFARICLAARSFFSPSRILMRGEPPTPTKKATEEMRVTIGPQIPTPANAISPVPAILPIYILSTIL